MGLCCDPGVDDPSPGKARGKREGGGGMRGKKRVGQINPPPGTRNFFSLHRWCPLSLGNYYQTVVHFPCRTLPNLPEHAVGVST